MKNHKYIVAMAVFIMITRFSAYAGNYGINDVTTGALNINTATAEELSMLPFVSTETAQNIVYYRDSNGPFTEIDELMKVTGVTRTLMDDLRAHLKLFGTSDFNSYAVQ